MTERPQRIDNIILAVNENEAIRLSAQKELVAYALRLETDLEEQQRLLDTAWEDLDQVRNWGDGLRADVIELEARLAALDDVCQHQSTCIDAHHVLATGGNYCQICPEPKWNKKVSS